MTSVLVGLEPAEGPPADLELIWSGTMEHPINGRFGPLLAGLEPADAALDLLLLACSVWATDKAIPRKPTQDRWTRTIELDVPQIEPDRLDCAIVEHLLGFLSGDRWRIRTHGTVHAKARLGLGAPDDGVTPRPVALFSGGLDSFAHAAAAPPDPITFVAYKDASELANLQPSLLAQIAPDGTPWELRQHFLGLARRGPLAGVDDLESSTRCRSLLFYASATAVAAALDSRDVVVPENGFISLNPPLVPARRGTLTTRTTHPWTIHLVNELIGSLGLDITVRNPLGHQTKGDIAAVALEHAPTEAVYATVSCSRARPRYKAAVAYGNCGYCFPCLVRRAGFHAAGAEDRTVYLNDPRTHGGFLSSSTGDDFRAVVARARVPFLRSDLTVTGPLPAGTDMELCLDVANRSRLELSAMIDDGLSAAVRARVGW